MHVAEQFMEEKKLMYVTLRLHMVYRVDLLSLNYSLRLHVLTTNAMSCVYVVCFETLGCLSVIA